MTNDVMLVPSERGATNFWWGLAPRLEPKPKQDQGMALSLFDIYQCTNDLNDIDTACTRGTTCPPLELCVPIICAVLIGACTFHPQVA